MHRLPSSSAQSWLKYNNY